MPVIFMSQNDIGAMINDIDILSLVSQTPKFMPMTFCEINQESDKTTDKEPLILRLNDTQGIRVFQEPSIVYNYAQLCKRKKYLFLYKNIYFYISYQQRSWDVKFYKQEVKTE